MKFINRSEPVRNTPGGFVGTPIPQDWRKTWEENRAHNVQLSCDCKTDLNDRTLLIINSFKDCTVYCETHHEFAKVKQVWKHKSTIPQEPLF